MESAAIAAVIVLAAPSAALAQGDVNLLATRSGLEIGLQAAYYDYEEPNFAELKGPRIGIVAVGTFASDAGGLFGKIDLRLSKGTLNYYGSGTMSGVPDFIVETRAVLGVDVIGSGVSFSPYAGLGYRYLYDDLNGISSTGAAGYRRYSNYLYAPVGLTMRFDTGSGWVIAPTAEIDIFIQGKQKSMLSDVNPALPNVTNTQNSGTGFRAYLMFESKRVAVGPYFHYWHIKDSDVQQGGLEPENFTHEYGLEVRFRF